MAQYKIATSKYTLTLEAENYVMDSNGIRFFAKESVLVGHFPTYSWFARVDALKTETESAE